MKRAPSRARNRRPRAEGAAVDPAVVASGAVWLAALVSAVHLLCLAGGVTTLVLRERALAARLDDAGVQRVLRLDNLSGIIAILWMGSGLWRAFGSLEKGSSFYLESTMFWVKMSGLALAWACETPSMVTFIRWRMRLAAGQAPDLSGVGRLRRWHYAEGAAMVLTVFAASLMSRGVGAATARTTGSSDGAAIYAASCAACHQADGRGLQGRLAADFVGDPTRLAKPDAVLLQSITEGVPGTTMPGFRDTLSEGDRRAVLTHLRARFGPP